MKVKFPGIIFPLLVCLCGSLMISGCGGGGSAGKYGIQPADTVPDDTTNNAPGEEDAFGNIMHTTWAKIDSVSFGSPVANQATRITARITPMGDADEEQAVTRTATLIYSAGDGADKQVTMAPAGVNTFVGDIPGQASNAIVNFYVRVQDNFGNVTTGAFPSSSGNIYLASGVADVDNSEAIVPDDMDLLDMSVGYDSDHIYVSYSVQGDISGGTMDPPYLHIYGIKFTNPEIETQEGLMVGKLWMNYPLSQTPDGQELFAGLLGQVGSLPEGVSQDDVDEAMESGNFVLDIGKVMSGYIMDGLLFSAQPEGTAANGVFTGSVHKDVFGDMPSGYLRVLTMTSANASLDSFMPIPLNCSHYLTLKTGYYSYAIP